VGDAVTMNFGDSTSCSSGKSTCGSPPGKSKRGSAAELPVHRKKRVKIPYCSFMVESY